MKKVLFEIRIFFRDNKKSKNRKKKTFYLGKKKDEFCFEKMIFFAFFGKICFSLVKYCKNVFYNLVFVTIQGIVQLSFII